MDQDKLLLVIFLAVIAALVLHAIIGQRTFVINHDYRHFVIQVVFNSYKKEFHIVPMSDLSIEAWENYCFQDYDELECLDDVREQVDEAWKSIGHS